MQYIPLTYFGVLFLVLLKRKGLDACSYVVLMYLITSIASVLAFKWGMIIPPYTNPSFFATVIYCLLITISILPIYKFSFYDFNVNINEKFIDVLVYLFFFIFFFVIITNFKQLLFIINYGDFDELRDRYLNGESFSYTGSALVHYIGLPLGILSSASFIMILIFFISLAYLNKSWKYNVMAFVGSLTSILNGILGINRSCIFYFLALFGLCAVIFWKKIDIKIKAKFMPIVAVCFFGMLVYFGSVTSDRFEGADRGPIGGIVEYTGMPYTNFCYMFDNYHNPTGISTRFLLPFTNMIINGYEGGVDREIEMSKKTGFDCVVFMTFLGSFIMDCNQVAPFIFLIVYVLLFQGVLNRQRGDYLTMGWAIFAFCLLSIPTIGCISYYFTSPFKNFAIMVILLISRIYNSK